MVAIPFGVLGVLPAAGEATAPLFKQAAVVGRAWPSPIALAASWDPDLVRELHSAIAAEAAGRGARMVVAPSLDLARDPRLGRIERTFGADPYLTAEMGVAAIRGLQGAGTHPMLAAVPGFGGPASPGPGSDVNPVPVSERELREFYFVPFEAAVRRAGPAAIVVARNAIDAVPSHANPWLLRTVLREEWGFRGAVLADSGGVADLKDVYRVATSSEAAAALALASGIDAELDTGARVDAAGAGAPPLPPIALRAAERSIVLLRNDGVLPFAAKESARSRRVIAVVEPAGLGLVSELRARLASQADVVAGTSGDALARAHVVVLAAVDVALAEAALEDLRRAGFNVVVVMVGERPAMSPALAENSAALVAAWGLGDACGKAVAAVLAGEVNPGGKLPLSLARNPGQWPMHHDVKPSARRGYLFDTTEPLFPFGWGIGYAAFELGVPRLSAASIDAKGSVKVEVDVRNTGQREGEETVQLYVRDKVSSVARPVKSLAGFQRVRIGAGESRTVTFTLVAATLGMWDEAMRRVVEPGDFEVMTGPDSAHLQSATFTVRGTAP